MEISFRKFYGPGLMFIGLLILTIFSFQYPFMAKIPLGNDDPTHIQTARYPFIAPAFSSVSKKLSVFKSTYPLSEVLFTLARFLPFSWSQRFMIWMALGHLLSGIALGYLLKKIAGTGPAVVGMIFWAISAIGVLCFI
jgi:hypothetical protein